MRDPNVIFNGFDWEFNADGIRFGPYYTQELALDRLEVYKAYTLTSPVCHH